jgi:integrase
MARTRRSKGDGSITERPDGLFEIRIDLGVVNGKRKRKSVYAKSLKEARSKLKELQRQLEAGIDLSGQMPTMAQFLEQWLTQIVAVNNAPSTIRSYRDAVEHHIKPYVGNYLLDRLTVQHVQAMIAPSQSKSAPRRSARPSAPPRRPRRLERPSRVP